MIQDWNEEVVRQYVQDFLSQREAEWQGKPFCMKIPSNTLQNQKIVMIYDKAQQPVTQNLVELPPWTGAGPTVPEIQAADVIKAIDLAQATATVIISGSSLESMKTEKKGAFHCKIETPI